MSIKRQFIREAVLRMHRQGIAAAAISRQSGVPETTVRRWIAQSDPDCHKRNLARARAQKECKERDSLAVVALTHQGLSPTRIAEHLRINVRRVHRLLCEHRRSSTEAEMPSPREMLRERIAVFRRLGLSMRNIAALTGRSLGTVHYHLSSLGLHGRIDTAPTKVSPPEGTGGTANRPRKTGRPAETATLDLLVHVAEYAGYRITPVDSRLDDIFDLLLVIGNYTLLVQVRTVRRRGNGLHASITRADGDPYGPETCDLFFAYDERTHALYCRVGADVWRRRASVALRAEHAVSRADPRHALELIEVALKTKLRRLQKECEEEATEPTA